MDEVFKNTREIESGVGWMDLQKSRDWNAWTEPGNGISVTLHVSGKVKTSAANQMPEIPEATPQGVEPEILVLDLVIVTVGPPGLESPMYRQAHFSKDVAPGRYSTVHIRSQGQILAVVEILDKSGSLA